MRFGAIWGVGSQDCFVGFWYIISVLSQQFVYELQRYGNNHRTETREQLGLQTTV